MDATHRQFVLDTVCANGTQVLISAAERAILDVPALAGLPWLQTENDAAFLEDGAA